MTAEFPILAYVFGSVVGLIVGGYLGWRMGYQAGKRDEWEAAYRSVMAESTKHGAMR